MKILLFGSDAPRWHQLTSYLIIMKIIFMLLLVSILQANARSMAQTVTLSGKQLSIASIFSEIKKQTQYKVICDADVIESTPLMEVRSVDVPLKVFLDDITASNGLTYIIKNKTIAVRKAPRKNVTQEAQQQQEVTGRVVDEDGEPLPSVTVRVKQGTASTQTDADGRFRMVLNQDNEVLQFTIIGFATVEREVAAGAHINVVLQSEVTNLDDVVVVGYGVQKKVNLTGAIASVDSKLLNARPLTNLSTGLAGLLPGVYIRQTTSLPGGDDATIRVRGLGTLNNASPMVLVDGIESSMSYINPEDVANVTVLKDASSAAIYGSKAANGVILITTKKGEIGRPVVSISSNFGIQEPTRLPEYVSSAEHAQLYNEALQFDGNSPYFTEEDIELFKNGSDPLGHPNTDWLGQLYQGSGVQHIHTASIAGGSEKATYRTSVNYQNQRGIVRYTGHQKYGVHSNMDYQPLDWLETGFNLSFNRGTQEQPNNAYVGNGLDQIIRQANRIAPWVPYKDENGDYGTIGDGNPLAWIDQGAQINRLQNHFLGTGSITIKPVKNLAIKGVASIKTFSEDKNEFNKELQYNPAKYHGPTKVTQTYLSDERSVGEIIANYDVNAGLHELTAMAGFHGELYKYKITTAYRQGFPSNELRDLDGGGANGMKNSGYTRALAMLSYFGRVNYAYDHRYLLEVNLRRDGSSRFSSDQRWGSFPSFSAGWVISREAFFAPLSSTVTELKIRGSWGRLGNQDALNQDNNNNYYPTIPILSLGYDYPFNSTIRSGAAFVDARNPFLSWEKATTKGIGLDLTIKRKLTVNIDLYERLTDDIIMTVPSPETFALNNFIDNIGQVSNRGIEVNVSGRETFGNFGFSYGLNVAYNHNELRDLGGRDAIITGLTVRKIGEPIDAFFGYDINGIFKTDDEAAAVANQVYNAGTFRAGDLRYVDTNKDGVVNAADRTTLGNSMPTTNYGVNLGVTYRNFDLLAVFNGSLGGYGYMNYDAIGGINGDAQRPAKLWLDRWTPENSNATVPRLRTGVNGPNMPQTNVLSYWVRSTDYLRLKNIQIGYTLPKTLLQRIGMSNARLYFSSQNTFTITNFLKGWDPEAPSGRGSAYPVVRINSFGFQVSF